MIELHGSLWRVRCDVERRVVANDQLPIDPRRCRCGAYWRPDIVWFEDALDPANIERAIEAMQSCDLLVSVGTSGVVYPAAELPRYAMQGGAMTVEINPEETPVSHLYRQTIRKPASQALRELWP